MKHRKIALWLLVVLFASLACSTSLSQPATAPVTAPTTGEKLDFPTPVVVTNTPVPQIESPLYFERLEDGSTRVSNSELHYQVVFDGFWEVIPMDEQMQAVLMDAADEQLGEEFQQLIDISRQQTGMQFIAFDKDMTFSVDVLSITNVSMIYYEDSTVSMFDMNYLLQENVNSLPSLIPDVVVSDTSVRTSAKGLEYGWLVMTHPATTFGYPAKQAVAMFKLGNGLITFTCSTHETMFPTAEQFFQMVVDSFEQVN